jgi:hypothetical protein
MKPERWQQAAEPLSDEDRQCLTTKAREESGVPRQGGGRKSAAGALKALPLEFLSSQERMGGATWRFIWGASKPD